MNCSRTNGNPCEKYYDTKHLQSNHHSEHWESSKYPAILPQSLLDDSKHHSHILPSGLFHGVPDVWTFLSLDLAPWLTFVPPTNLH